MLNFNRANLSDQPINRLVNELIEATAPPSENNRPYLGASAIGSECLRRVQYDWMCDPEFPVGIKDIFARGHFFEEVTRQHLIAAGFKFAPTEQLEFKAADRLLRGHADGIIIAGPALPGLSCPCIWECKCLKAKGWRAISRRQQPPPEFYDADGYPRWKEIALFCQRNIARLRDEREKEFVNDMAGKMTWHEPTERQGKWLFASFVRLGGKYDPKTAHFRW
jgi:hypothetical protein